jgi:chemotaxis regulatin CheY-phosphate phosphatase CheZ
MSSLITTAVLIIAAILLYRFRAPLIAALRRFDARNVERIEEEIGDRRDRLAHYKHTLRLAEEQVEDVSEIAARDARTGQALRRYVFEGEQFATRDEAEAARQRSIVAKARKFYEELPAALAHRRKETLN